MTQAWWRLLVWLACADPGVSAGLKLDGVLVTLIEQVEIPARDAGVLTEMPVDAGNVIKQDQLVAQLDDEESKLKLERAAAEVMIAKTEAQNELRVRFAQAAADIAQAEYKRARESVERFQRSISQSELDKLKLEAEQSLLAVQQAQHDQVVAKQTLLLKEREYDIAKQAVSRRRIVSPLEGVVVQLLRRRGEWVEPGQAVVRVLRIDRLRVEGFVSADRAAASLVGSRVQLLVDLPEQKAAAFSGALVFVSPEVDPVNGQIRIRAEVDNRERLLRPGLRGTLVIGGN